MYLIFLPSGFGKLKKPSLLESHWVPTIRSDLQSHWPLIWSQIKVVDPNSLQLHSFMKEDGFVMK